MRIDNLAKIIEGAVINSPSIAFFDQIKISSKRIKRADALFCIDGCDIKEAIKNGAYAIVFDSDIEISDNEIAWIRVGDIKKSIIRYLRYKFINSSEKLFYCDDITFQILKSVSLCEKFIFLDEDIYDNFRKISDAKSDTIFISNSKYLAKQISPESKEIELKEKIDINIIKKTLFQSDFIYNEQYYKNITIPSIFTKHLKKALYFLSSNRCKFKMENLYIKKHFEPIFIDNGFNVKDFGTSGKVLIIEKDKDLIKKESEYIKAHTKYATSYIYIPSLVEMDMKDGYEKYEKYEDLLKIGDKNYNFLLILLKKDQEIFDFLKNRDKQRYKTLF